MRSSALPVALLGPSEAEATLEEWAGDQGRDFLAGRFGTQETTYEASSRGCA